MSSFLSRVESNPGVLLAGVVGGAVAMHTIGMALNGWCPVAQSKAKGGCPFSGKKSSTGSCPASASSSSSSSASKKAPVVVTITGAAGHIGYASVFQIAAGKMLGPDQPVELRLLEITNSLPILHGVCMELDDCAFPLLTKVVPTDDVKVAFEGSDIAILIGARPRGPGMTRADLLQANADIFKVQGKALNDYAKKSVKVLVVGNPANTNAKIAMENAPDLPKSAFTAMTRLDQNRAAAQLAHKAGISVGDVKNVIVWGNHSDTQVPDVSFATLKGVNAIEAMPNEKEWLQDDFMRIVQKRGAAVIDAMKKSSAASAANAAVEHVRSWVLGTAEGEYVSMAVPSNGEYGVPKDLIFSYPCTCKNGVYTIVPNLAVSDFIQQKMKISWEQLQQEENDWKKK